MKRNVFIPVYCILVGLIFLGTIAYSCTSLYKENNKGYIESKVKFDSMSAEIKKAFENPYSPDLADKLYKAAGDYNDYAFISVKVNGNTIFLYPGDMEEPTGNTKFSKHYIKTITSPDLNLSISANVYTLKPASIAWHAKTAFIVILIFTIITILIIVYISMNNSEEESESIEDTNLDVTDESEISKAEDEELPKEVVSETKEAKEESEKITENLEPVNQDSSENETDIEAETDEINNETQETDEIEESKEVISEEVPVNESTDVDSEETIDSTVDVECESSSSEPTITEESEVSEKENNEPVEEVNLPVTDCKPMEETPNGLFNPETGFGWESYLVTRLENELSRASASEFDVVLFLIKVPSLKTMSEEKFQELCSSLTNMFQFKDFIFEYKENGFAAIKTNTTIDEAIPLADQIYSEISGIIPSEKCYIGLSSKTIRLISAERLIKEADAALSHAEEDPENPIIAFRADAEKYMDFIEKN